MSAPPLGESFPVDEVPTEAEVTAAFEAYIEATDWAAIGEKRPTRFEAIERDGTGLVWLKVYGPSVALGDLESLWQVVPIDLGGDDDDEPVKGIGFIEIF